MKRTRRATASNTSHFISAFALTALAFAWSCGRPPLAPFPGAPDALGLDFVVLPVGALNVAGGNFLLSRTDLTIDTRLGAQAFGGTWNSATATWRWSTDLTYDGATFVDASGASHDVGTVQAGRAIPGTHWRVVDATHLKTKGGLVHAFGSDGRLEEIHWSGDAFPDLRFLYTAPGGPRRLVTVEQCTSDSSCAAVFDVAYDGSGHLRSVTDRGSRVVAYAYDSDDRLIAVRDPVATATGGPGIRYRYAGGQISTVTDGDDEEIDLTYDASNRLTRLTQVGEENPSWAFSYFASGRYRTLVRDPLGNVTSFFYDRAGHLRELDQPSGATWTWTWSGERIAAVTDPRQATTTFISADDDPVEITQPSGNIVDVSYRPDAENRMHPNRTAVGTASDPLGTILRATYDAAGRLTGVTNGAEETLSFTYDGLGELATSTTPGGYTTHYGGYGEHGHATSISTPLATSTAVYDAVGDLLQGSSPRSPGFGTSLGGVVSRSFDADRRVQTEVLAATGGATSTLRVDRRADGRPLAIRRPYGGETDFVYDAIGRLVARKELVDGVWRTTDITRDAMGRPASVVRPNGMEVDRTWNADGQLATLSRLRNGSLEATATYTYAGGLLASIQDSVGGGTESYERDASGRPTAIHFASGETLQIQYDARERETQETYQIAGDDMPLRTIGYTYDGANRRVGLLDDGAPIVTYTFSQGRISSIDYGNGLTRSFGYDATSSFINASQTQDATGNTVESTVLDWRSTSGLLPAGLLVTSSETLPVMSIIGSYWVVSTRTQAGPSGGRAEDDCSVSDSTYQYDALSNITHGTFASSSSAQDFDFVYNAEHNRLLSTRDSSTGNPIHGFAYDVAGFVTQRDGVRISWTADGRLSSVGSSSRLSWDLEGRIVSLDIAGQTRRFLFGGRVEADASHTPEKLMLGAAEIDLSTGNRLYRHFDFRGNVSFVTDSSGAVVRAYDYSDFGVERSFGAVTGRRAFAQGRLLSGGLFLMGSRLYDSAAGRFLSPDPILQLENQYAYAMGNPIQFWDPGATSAGSTVAFAVGTVVAAGSATIGGPGGAGGIAFGIGIEVGALFGQPSSSTTKIVAIGLSVAAPLVGAFSAGVAAGASLATRIDGLSLGGAPSRLNPSPPFPNPDSPHGGLEEFIDVADVGSEARAAAAAVNATGMGGGGGGGGGFGGGGGAGGFCSASALQGSEPSLAWLWLLGPLEVGLGAWLLRVRQHSARGRNSG